MKCSVVILILDNQEESIPLFFETFECLYGFIYLISSANEYLKEKEMDPLVDDIDVLS